MNLTYLKVLSYVFRANAYYKDISNKKRKEYDKKQMKTPVEKQGTSIFTACNINKATNKFNKEILDRFKHDKSLREGFLKLATKGKYIMREKEITLMEYIYTEYDSEIYENINRIWQGQNLTKDINDKLKTWSRESRNCKRLLLDTTSSWVTENYVKMVLEGNKDFIGKYTVELNGSDKKRKIEMAYDCDREPDLKITNRITGEITYMEIMEDVTAYVKRYNKFDLRFGNDGSKYQSLIDLSLKSQSEVKLVIVDIKNDGLISFPIQNVKVIQKKYKNRFFNNRLCTELGVNHEKYFKSFQSLKSA